MLEKIGYIAPKNSDLEFLHNEINRILRIKFSDITQIICACFCTMNDINGESIGLFFTLPDRFCYIAGVPDKKCMIFEEFPIDKISEFTTIGNKKNIHAIKFKIYNEYVVVNGFEMRISSNFINRLKKSGIILFELATNKN